MSTDLYTVHVCDPDIHASALCSMIQELADFEKLPDGPKLTKEQIAEDLKKNHCFAYIASKNDDGSNAESFVGYALCYYAYSTWEGKFLFLEDLYVKPEHRKCGVGNKLLRCILQKAYDEKLPRVQWNVLNWNTNAIEYYKRLGGIDLHETEGWVQFRLTKESIENFFGPT